MFYLLLARAMAAGPWTVGMGVASVYIGSGGEIYRTITYRTDAGLEQKELGEGLASLDFQAIFSYGLTPRLQFDLNVPWRGTHVSRKDTDVCVELGDGACDATLPMGPGSSRRA